MERFVFAASGRRARFFCRFRRLWTANAPLFCQLFPETRSLASRPVCQNSISALFCLQVYHLQCTCQCEDWQYSCTLGFKSHFKLVVFLGIRTGTSWPRAAPGPCAPPCLTSSTFSWCVPKSLTPKNQSPCYLDRDSVVPVQLRLAVTPCQARSP
jgi:hypothetical protein